MTQISKSTYYYRPKVSRAQRDKRDADLRDKIEYLQAEYSCYGYRTLRKQFLRQYDMVVNGKRLLRIMRKYSLLREVKRRFIATTDSNHAHKVYPNLLKGREVTGVNQVWVADITYSAPSPWRRLERRRQGLSMSGIHKDSYMEDMNRMSAFRYGKARAEAEVICRALAE